MEQCAYVGRGPGAARRLHRLGRSPDDSGRSARRSGICKRRSPTSRSSPTCSTCSARRSTAARACSCTARRATARRRSPSGSRSASAARSGFRSTITEDGQFIKLFDAACHEPIDDTQHGPAQIGRARPPLDQDSPADGRRRRRADDGRPGNPPRPGHQRQRSRLQLKSNCGCLLIDDFGRQRMSPDRAAQPLDRAAGKPLRLPDAGDRQEDSGAVRAAHHLLHQPGAEGPGRRGVPPPHSVQDRSRRSRRAKSSRRCSRSSPRACTASIEPEAVDYLIEKHYKPVGRPLRRCQPRDLLYQVRNYCVYNELPVEMRPEYFDRVVPSYFTVVSGK